MAQLDLQAVILRHFQKEVKRLGVPRAMEILDCSSSNIGHLMRGRHGIRLKHIEKIAKAQGQSFATLLAKLSETADELENPTETNHQEPH